MNKNTSLNIINPKSKQTKIKKQKWTMYIKYLNESGNFRFGFEVILFLWFPFPTSCSTASTSDSILRTIAEVPSVWGGLMHSNVSLKKWMTLQVKRNVG